MSREGSFSLRRRKRKREVGGGVGEDRREGSEDGNLRRWGLLLSLVDERRRRRKRDRCRCRC